MAQGTAANVGLGQLFHANGRHHARVHASLLQHVLERERVDHGAEHAHVIGGDAIHAHGRELRPANDVAATDDQPDSDAHPDHALDLVAELLYAIEIESDALVAGEGLAGELEQYALVR